MSFLGLFLQASLLVKFVMLLLLGMSIYSWTIILSRSRMLKAAKNALSHFEERFWSGHDLSRLFKETAARSERINGGEKIFYMGFKEFSRLHRMPGRNVEGVIDGAHRSMRVSLSREIDDLRAWFTCASNNWFNQPIYWFIWYSMGDYEFIYCIR